VALKVKHSFLSNVSEFGGFDGMQPILAGPHTIERVKPRRIPRMNDCAFIPIPTIDLDRISHGGFPDLPRRTITIRYLHRGIWRPS
jgi:hypothetical protein